MTPETTCTEPTNESQFRELGPGEYSCEKIYPIDFCEEKDDSTAVEVTTSATMAATTPAIDPVSPKETSEETAISEETPSSSSLTSESEDEEESCAAHTSGAAHYLVIAIATFATAVFMSS